MERLGGLQGTWVGEGVGDFPTIDAFRYRETLRFDLDSHYPLMHYEQRTWLLPEDEPSHWESGFLRVLEDGGLELSNAQNGVRVEVLRGRVGAGAAGQLRLEFDSAVIGNDPRILRTRRIFTLEGDRLEYTQWMATGTTPEPEFLQHIEARLLRRRA